MNTLKITQHNDFVIYLPLVVLNTWGAEAVNPALITDTSAVVKQSFEAAITPDTSIVESVIVLKFDETLKTGRYDATISFKYEGRDVAKNIKDFFCIVEYDQQSNWRDYIIGDHVVTDTQAFIAGAHYTDAEYEQLKQQLTQAIEQVEEEKAEWQRKVQELTDVAKETKATANKNEVLRAIGNIPEPVIHTDYAKEVTLQAGTAAILHKIETTQPDLSAIAKEQTLNQQSAEIKTAIAKGGGNPSKMAFEAMKRKSEYLYEIEYSELDYEAARDYFATHFVPISGACTALRKGNQLGRNYDWTYDKQVEFLVRTKAHNGRYASIGIAGSISALTTDTIGEYSEEFKYMPFRMLDGMNEKGLTANVNMLNHDEYDSLPVEGTTPRIEERESICSAMLVRYILDNFATPQEACEYIRDYVRVYPPYHDGKTTDLHFALTNKEQLYYLCFGTTDGGHTFRTMIADVKDQPLPFVMTNFRMWWASRIFDTETGYYDRFADPNYEYVEKYGMGIERANLCLDFVRDTETEQSVLDFMTNDLKYTNAYSESVTPTWLTEFVGDYETLGDIPRDGSDGEFDGILDIVRQRYAERSRETALTWQTVHSVVYDLDNLTIQLVTQEGSADDALTIDCFKALPASKGDLGNIDFGNLATLANQRKMMVNFGMSEGEPQLQALTDTEIINTYDGYDSEGQHIEGIADTTYGHLVPAEVTIDDEPFTFYVERTYSDYGYSVLYRNGVAIDTTTTHPQEDDELTTTNE